MNYFRSTASGEVFSLPDRLAVTPPNGCERVVVISPEDREQIERLTDAYEELRPASTALFGHMQAALRSLVADPKPDEPQGLGAVVEDDRGVVWVRTEKAKGVRNPWQATLNVAEPDDIRQLAYADVAAVRVLSEGWSE